MSQAEGTSCPLRGPPTTSAGTPAAHLRGCPALDLILAKE